jgi:hypothetical protein
MGFFKPAPTQVPQAPAAKACVAFQDDNILVNFKLERDPSAHTMHKIAAVYSNKSLSKLDKINMQVFVKNS